MAHSHHTIVIQPLAPAKVALGVACNGCGVCCLFEPCPLGIVLSRTRKGACHALRWNGVLRQYRCGALVASEAVLAQSLPRLLRRLAPVLAPVLQRWAERWIAAGSGCDSRLEVVAQDEAQDGPMPTHAGSKTMADCDAHASTSTPTRPSLHD